MGVEDWNAKDQLALAIDSKGIVALGRKFHPAPSEFTNMPRLAASHLIKEQGYPRIFTIKRNKIFLTVCYDVLGLVHQRLENPGIAIVLNCTHYFFPIGEELCSDSRFARLGLAGASRQWKCPVFASTLYVNRAIGSNWPSGVLWKKGNKDQRKWKYRDNYIAPSNEIEISQGIETAVIRFFMVKRRGGGG
jgi:hypothetical protein